MENQIFNIIKSDESLDCKDHYIVTEIGCNGFKHAVCVIEEFRLPTGEVYMAHQHNTQIVGNCDCHERSFGSFMVKTYDQAQTKKENIVCPKCGSEDVFKTENNIGVTHMCYDCGIKFHC